MQAALTSQQLTSRPVITATTVSIIIMSIITIVIAVGGDGAIKCATLAS